MDVERERWKFDASVRGAFGVGFLRTIFERREGCFKSFGGSFRFLRESTKQKDHRRVPKGGLFHDGPVTCMDSIVDESNNSYVALTGSEDCALKLSAVNTSAESAERSKVLGNFLAHEVHRHLRADFATERLVITRRVEVCRRDYSRLGFATQKVRGVLGHGKAVSQLKWVPNSAMLYRCATARSRFSSLSLSLPFSFLQQKGTGATS